MLTAELETEVNVGTRWAVRRILSTTYRDSVDDVLQTASLNALRHANQFRGDSKFGTWFHRIAVNEALLHRRRNRKTVNESVREANNQEFEFASVLESRLDEMPNPEERLILLERRKRLVDAIRTLSPKLRQAVILNKVRGYLLTEISEMLGLTENTVKARVHRGICLLRQHLREPR